MASADWRNSVCPKVRQLIVDTFIETLSELSEHVPETVQPHQIQALAMKFEEMVYSTATSREDYLKKISVKGMLLKEKFHKYVPNSLGSDSSCIIDPLPDPASQNMNSKMNVQLPPVTAQSAKQSQVQQQQMFHNTRNVIASPGVQGPMPNVAAENPTQQNISGILQGSVQNSMAQRQQSLQNQQQGLTSHKSSGHHQSQPPILKQITMETVSGSFQTHTGRQGHSQQDKKQLQPVCSQPHHAHPIHLNLLPLQKQSQLMGQRLGTVNVQQGQLINNQHCDVPGMQQHGKNHVNSFGNSSMLQDAVALQGQAKRSASVLLQVQGQHSHLQPRKENLASHSKPANLQQALKPSQQDMQHRLYTSADRDCCLSTKEHLSLEEALAKIEHLKMKYLARLNAQLHILSTSIKSSGSRPQKPGHVEGPRLKEYYSLVCHVISFLKNPRDMNDIFNQLDRVEQRIINIINSLEKMHMPLTVHSMNQYPCHAHRQMTQDEKKPLLHSATTVHQNNDSLSSSSQQNNMHMQQHSAAPDSKVGILMKSSAQIAVGFQPRQEIVKQQMHQPLTQQRRQINTGAEHQPMNEVKNVNLSQQQHQSAGQRSSYPHHRSIAGTLSSASVSQLLQAVTPHTKNKSYPPGSLAKDATALCNRNFPSMSSSHEQRDSKKLNCDVSSLSNGGNDKNQQMKGAVEPPTSPLLADSNDTQSHPSTSISDESSVADQPIQRLLKVMSSMSAKALSASVSEIGSIVSVTDRMAEVPTQSEESECDVGEDMWAMTKCHLQSRFFTDMDFSLGTRKRKCGTGQIPLDIVAYAGGIHSLDSATSCVKRPSVNTNHSLLEEIRKVNQQLIDTVVDISDETTSGFDEGTIVTCSFGAPNIMTSSLILRVLVPINYPSCSPILLDKLISELSETEDVREKAKRKAEESLALLHPFSIGEIAKTWDQSARSVILEVAMQGGGGTFTSKYGAWDKCLTVL